MNILSNNYFRDLQMQDVLLHVKHSLDANPRYLLQIMLGDIQERVIEEIDSLNHIGFMVPPGVTIDTMKVETGKAGFPLDHRSFSSLFLTKELGVPAQILKAWGLNHLNQKAGIELFFPEASSEVVDRWIQEGVGAHAAFKVKSLRSLEKAMSILEERGFVMPGFMGGKAIYNDKDKSTTAYYEVKLKNENYRIELLHKDE